MFTVAPGRDGLLVAVIPAHGLGTHERPSATSAPFSVITFDVPCVGLFALVFGGFRGLDHDRNSGSECVYRRGLSVFADRLSPRDSPAAVTRAIRRDPDGTRH
jgi:hypothetical protein